MKKAIIILALLSIITIGLGAYEGYLYIQSLNELYEAETSKQELIETNVELESGNIELNKEYNEKTKELLENNKGCELWGKLSEALKKTEE